MDKKDLTKIMSSALVFFYIGIVLYVFFAVLDGDTLDNFAAALVFEIIGFILLAFYVLSNVFAPVIKIGYLVPLVMTSVVYTIILDVLNLCLIAVVPSTFFVLLNLILLFIYCLVSVPMFLMGRR